MVDSTSKLIKYWRSLDLRIGPRNSEEIVRGFESRNDIELLPDFRDYLLNVDGMAQIGGHDCDLAGFAFWPLAQIQSMLKECTNHPPAESVPADPENYFVFADYLQWSWAYAIHLGTHSSEAGQIIHVGTLQPKVIAGSFTEFVDLYLQDARALYPDPE